MRFKLTLQTQPEVMGREMPINYQYPLQAAVCHTQELMQITNESGLGEKGSMGFGMVGEIKC